GNYEFGPITVEPCRAKARPLRPRRSYFAPVPGISNQWSWIRTSDRWLLTTDPLMVEAPGTAPGSDRFITTVVYRHSRLAPAATNIGAQGWRKKSKERRLQGEAGSPRPLQPGVVVMLSTRPSATLGAAARHNGFGVKNLVVVVVA